MTGTAAFVLGIIFLLTVAGFALTVWLFVAIMRFLKGHRQ